MGLSATMRSAKLAAGPVRARAETGVSIWGVFPTKSSRLYGKPGPKPSVHPALVRSRYPLVVRQHSALRICATLCAKERLETGR